MKNNKIFWGITLVIIGILFILKNVGVIALSWFTLRSLWPIAIVLWGVSLLPIKINWKIIISIIVMFLASIIASRYHDVFQSKRSCCYNKKYKGHEYKEDRYESPRSEAPRVLSQPYSPEQDVVKLEMNFGAGEFEINQTTTELISVDLTESDAIYSLETQDQEGVITNLSLNMKSNEYKRNFLNDVFIKLNPNPVWDMDLNIGASEIDFDLSRFKVKNIDLNAGAADIDIKLGSLQDDVKLSIEAGLADLTVKVPADVGVKINSSSFLANKEFRGFEKKDGIYYSPNYNQSTKKINIEINSSLADISVERY